MQTFLHKLGDNTARILLLCSFICFLGLVCTVILQVITRLFLPITISWTEEISRFFFLFSISFAAPVALHHKELVFVDLLVMHFSSQMQFLLVFVADLLIFILSLGMTIESFTYTKLGIGQLSPAFQLPMWIPHSSMFILSFFLMFFTGISLLRHVHVVLPVRK